MLGAILIYLVVAKKAPTIGIKRTSTHLKVALTAPATWPQNADHKESARYADWPQVALCTVAFEYCYRLQYLRVNPGASTLLWAKSCSFRCSDAVGATTKLHRVLVKCHFVHHCTNRVQCALLHKRGYKLFNIVSKPVQYGRCDPIKIRKAASPRVTVTKSHPPLPPPNEPTCPS